MARKRVARVGAPLALRDLVPFLNLDGALEADQVSLRIDRADRNPWTPAMLAAVAWCGFPGAEPQGEASRIVGSGGAGVPRESRKVERQVEGDDPGAGLVGERQEDLVNEALPRHHLKSPGSSGL